MLFKQLPHAGGALAIGSAAKHDRDQMLLVAAKGRQKIVAGSFGEAGLDAVHALHVSEQRIVVVHFLAAVREARCCEIAVISREAVTDGAAENRLIAGGGDLLV